MIKLRNTIFAGFLILSLGCTTENRPTTESYTVLQGATIFDGSGESITDGVIVVHEGIIEAVGDKDLTIPSNAEIIDVSGKFITPGIVDAHVHFFQTGFFDSRPDAFDIRDSISYEKLQAYLQTNPERYYETYLRSGVTSVYDVGGFTWSIGFQKSAENNLNAPHVAASGPLLSPVPTERLTTFNTPGDSVMLSLTSADFGMQKVQQYSSLGSTGIKIWQIQLDDPDFMNSLNAVANEIKIQNNQLIVHATRLDQAKEAMRLGAKVLVHSVEDQLVDDEFIQLAKENSVIYSPTLRVSRGYYNASLAMRGIMLELRDVNNVVDKETRNLLEAAPKFFKYAKMDPEDFDNNMVARDQRLKERESIMSENLKKLYDSGVTIVVATDAGNPGTLHGISIYAEMEAMQEAGIHPADIIVMATKNGAMAMRRFDDFGTLEKGKMADLIILNEDPSKDIANMRSITHVMRGGLLRPVKEPFE